MNVSFSRPFRTFLLLSLFGIAMGVLESIVVVYLRQIYYPGGFEFPLKALSPQMFLVEALRETTTIVMLVIVGMLAGQNFLGKFSCLLFTFGVWDIFYYVALKLVLDWPPSFLTWDVLFLIPLAWLAPVLAPIINSFTILLFAICLARFQHKGCMNRLKVSELGLIFVGSFLIFCTYVWDAVAILIRGGFLSQIWTLAENEQLRQTIAQYRPTWFNWYLFGLGEILILASLALVIRRVRISSSVS